MPIRFTIETTIDRPREEVFAFVCDPQRLRRWQPLVVEVELLDEPPLRQGSRLREVREVRGRRLAQTVRVSAFDPPSRFGLEILEGPIPVHGDLTFEPVPGGTLVRLHAHGQAPRLVRPLAPLLAVFLKRETRRQYARLKSVLESADDRGAGLPGRATG